jgi:hypothetical protein
MNGHHMPARSALGLLTLAAVYLVGAGLILMGEAAAGAVLVLAAFVAHGTIWFVLTRSPSSPPTPSKPRLRLVAGSRELERLDA